MRIFALVLLTLAGSFPLNYCFAEEAVPPSAEAAAESSAFDGRSSELTFEAPLFFRCQDALPLGFEGDSLLPPFNLIYTYRVEPKKRTVAFVGRANLTFPHASLLPAIGITPGLEFGPKKVTFEG